MGCTKPSRASWIASAFFTMRANRGPTKSSRRMTPNEKTSERLSPLVALRDLGGHRGRPMGDRSMLRMLDDAAAAIEVSKSPTFTSPRQPSSTFRAPSARWSMPSCTPAMIARRPRAAERLANLRRDEEREIER